MNHLNLRRLFKNFFEKHQHSWVQSVPLVPFDDPSLLFINAGMNPFKKKFLGIESAEHSALASIQKCVRAGGKHNDLEEVGPSLFHHTFFEMMGNFSFGKYFKEKGCSLAWDFLTKELGIPVENLAVSVFEKDKETARIWNKKINIPEEKIFFFGEKDNFWRMGEEGPCGPCTEIYYDTKGFKDSSSMIEIWNLVFMEYKENSQKKRTPLKQLCIDTGMGLERLLSVVQNKNSNYHTDLFDSVFESLSQKIGVSYNPYEEISSNVVLRALADHIRTTVFLIGDGVLPSHEGRGYVLRRILRRAFYLASTLTPRKEVLHDAARSVIQTYSSVYPELQEQKDLILKTLSQEEEKFLLTLKQGKTLLEKEIFSLRKQKKSQLSSPTSFKLYDTYGFPFDLIQMICNKEDIQIDRKGFEKQMNESRLKNKEQGRKKLQSASYSIMNQIDADKLQGLKETQFIGYDKLQTPSKIKKIFDSNGQSVSSLKTPCTAFVVFDRTPFYAEGGGQVGDQGLLFKEKGEKPCGQVIDCQQRAGRLVHVIKFSETVEENQKFILQVDKNFREQTAIHHSATHLLHSALRKVLGNRTKQSGSLVEPHRLRFDFSASQPLTEQQISQVEELVNNEIMNASQVQISFKNYEKALKEGALSFFDKPESHKVRVLKMGDFSHELCGGTHVQNTKDIITFKIMSEGSLSSGVRRIEAVCGKSALNYFLHFTEENIKLRKLLNLSSYPTQDLNLLETVQKLKEKPKKAPPISVKTSDLKTAEKFNLGSKKGVFYCFAHSDKDAFFLSSLCDQIKKDNPLSIVVVTGEKTSHTSIVVSLPQEISKDIKAQEVIQHLGGKGGGPPHFAQGALDQELSQKDLRQKTLSFFHKKDLLKELK